MQILHDYLHAIQSISESDKEHTHRSALENLFKAILAHLAQSHKDFSAIHIIHEPNNDKSENKAGAPDFQIILNGGGGQNSKSQSGLTLGYIENKRVNANLVELIIESNANPRAQIAKYLTLSDNLILTDYLRFLRIAKDDKGKITITQEITICTLNEIQATLKNKSTLQSKQKELLDFFTLFFNTTPKPIISALEFANALAQRTRLVFDILTQNPQNPQISTLYQNFREILYKDLNFESFCDSFAQTLTYALFLARLNDERGETIDLYNAKKFIPKSFPLIRAMSGFLDNLDELDSLKWLIKEILSIINHINPAQITLELNKIADKDLLGNYLHKDPYLHFYETFLSQYDPHLRELRGVYYTPFAVVSFIINAIDSTLKSDFGEAKGLGSALNNDNITLLDFATGTGTFLLEAFRKALESTPKNSLHYKPKNLLSKFSGFEFLIAPYTIAHLKISQSFKEEFNAPLNDSEKLNILLTNTLYDKSEKDERESKSNLLVGMYELANEFLQSQKVKNNNILIITGNPPYNYESINKYDYTYTLKDSKPKTLSKIQAHYFYCGIQANADKGDKIEPIYINEKNPKGLQDDYVKFIRFAESKIQSQENGIIAIISNNGFIDNPTFRGMRWHLLNTFDKIYILDLHGNTRKKEKSPDGSKDDNVFDIMQGVCISVFVKLHNQNKSAPPIIKVQTPPHIKWETYTNTPQCKVYHYDLFGRRKDKYAFLQGNGLDLVAWSELAPKAPFYLFIPQNESLREEYDKGTSVKDMFKVSSVGVSTSRDDFCVSKSDSDESLQELKNNIQRFMNLDSESARKEFDLGKDSRDWKVQYAQKELQSTNNNPNNYIKIQYRPFDFRWTYYTGKSKGFHSMPRGEVMKYFLGNDNIGLIYPRQIKESRSFQHAFISTNIIDKCSVSPSSFFAPLYDSQIENFTPQFRAFVDKQYGESYAPKVILGYIYAILYHKDYREKYVDFLKIDFPKVPFVKSKKDFLALSALGGDLIDLHLMRVDLSGESVGEPHFNDLGDKNEKIQKIAYNAESKKLFVNESLYFEAVSAEVWEYKIGGYAVLDKYLKSHKGESIDYAHFECVIKTLHKSLELESKIAKVAIE